MYKFKQKILFIFFTIIIVAMLIVPSKSFAVTPTSDYDILAYDIDMVVNEDNTFDITENITAYFNVQKHGIYRKIPFKNSVQRLDGTKSNNTAKITNISVSENYTTYNELGYKVIQIGDERKTLTGTHNYTIKYKYDIGKDPVKDADELYFNLIGGEWDAVINDVSFNITMPKAFDKSKLGFSSGNVGSTNSSNITCSIDGNTITGNLTDPLFPGQALTVRLTLPEGYFSNASSNFDMFPIITMIVCVIFVLIADRIWAKFGKDDKVIESVEFYPPEGYNSAEIALLYNGTADTEGIISLMVYLADKGYLKIEKCEDDDTISKSKNFKITKLKEYDGNNKYEKLFFEGLFKDKKVGESVTKDDLYNNFYKTIGEIRSEMDSKEVKRKIFEPKASGKNKYLIFMIFVIYALITVKPVLEYGRALFMPFALIFTRSRIYGSYISFN